MDVIMKGIFDKSKYIQFYIIGMVYVTCLYPMLEYVPVVNYASSFIFHAITYGWAILILIYDLVHGKMIGENLDKSIVIFSIAMVISTLIQSFNLVLQKGDYILSVFIYIYILYQWAIESDRESFLKVIIKCAKFTVYVVLSINILNLVLVICDFNGGTIPSIWSHLYVSPRQLSWRRTSYQYYGLYTHNILGAFKCYISLILTLFLVEHKEIKKSISIFSIVLCILQIYYCDSRNVMGITGIILLAWLKFCVDAKVSKEKAKKIYNYAISIFGISLCYVVYKSIVFNMNFIEGDFSFYKLFNRFTSLRLEYWVKALDIIKEKPFLGWGLKNNGPVGSYQASLYNYHNLVVNLLVWTGLIGTFLFSYFLIESYKKVRRNSDKIKSANVKWLNVLCICVFLQSLLDVGLIGVYNSLSTVYFWLCLGYLKSLGKIVE